MFNIFVILIKNGLYQSVFVLFRLAKVIFPSTFIMLIIQKTLLFSFFENSLNPIMSLVGLHGREGIAFLIGIFVNIYAGIAAMLTLGLSGKEIFSLSIMISLCHSLFMESAVIAAAGGNGILIFIVRLLSAFLTAALIALINS